jgi:uncharacterized protein (DUF2141 family)
MKFTQFLTFFFLVIPLLSLGQQTGDIHLIIQNIENENGTLRIGLFTEDDKFLGEASWSKDLTVKNEKNILVNFENIPYGTYAISIYHDLDDNGKLDTNFIGIPKEPVGFSNDHQPKMGPPKFNGAKFELNQEKLTLTVNMYTY